MAMRLAFVLCASLVMSAGASQGQLSQPLAHDPSPDPAAVVLCDRFARFTILTPRLVRAEYATQSPSFFDAGTFAFVNRRLPVPKFQAFNSSGVCQIHVEGGVSVYYTLSTGSTPPKQGDWFAAHKLTVNGTFDGIVAQYAEGDVPTGNLGGTVYQLDGVNGSVPLDKCTMKTNDPNCALGVLSTQGWTVYNDGNNQAFGQQGSWIPSPYSNKQGQDLYVFVYGRQFRLALQDLTAVAGRQLMPPRRFFGVWWSRYWKYSEQDLRRVISNYEDNLIPLDGINLDTEWHMNNNYLDSAPNKLNWYGGYFDWDTSLYADPVKMVERLQALNLWPVWFDIHQSPGVLGVNSKFAEFAQAMGVPNHPATHVPVQVDNQTFTDAFFKLLHQQTGASNYWWLDNGKALSQKFPLANFNGVLWDRIKFFQAAAANNNLKRPTVMGPFGGVGTHRYPFGHSGDTITSWATLNFVIRYTSTASNVLFGLITHDIGGHRDYDSVGNDPELYTRFVQYGVFSAMLRPHPQKAPSKGPLEHDERRIWQFPYRYFEPMRRAMQRRARLVPYVYTAVMQAYSTGVPFLRALYVDYPTDPQAFANVSATTYLFGDALVVKPVSTAMSADNVSRHTVYLPPASTWVEWDTGRCLVGGAQYDLRYALWETPVFVRAGSMLPMTLLPSRRRDPRFDLRSGSALQDALSHPPFVVGAAEELPATLVWEVFLGNATTGHGTVIEDDDSTNYTTGLYAQTNASFSYDDPGSLKKLHLSVYPVSSPSLVPPSRNYEFRIHNVLSPVAVAFLGATTDGDGGGASAAGDLVHWWEPETLTAVVHVPSVDVVKGVDVQVLFGTSPASELLCSSRSDFPGLHQRVMRAKYAVDDEIKLGALPSMALNRVQATPDRMRNNPATAEAELRGYHQSLTDAINRHLNATHGRPPANLAATMVAWFE